MVAPRSGIPRRWDVEKAVLAARLPSPQVCLMLVLLTYTGAKGDAVAVIPPKFSPSLTALTKASGLCRAAVALHLDKLESGGWITRERPETAEAIREKRPTAYGMHIPPQNATSPGDGLVQEVDQSRRWTSP